MMMIFLTMQKLFKRAELGLEKMQIEANWSSLFFYSEKLCGKIFHEL